MHSRLPHGSKQGQHIIILSLTMLPPNRGLLPKQVQRGKSVSTTNFVQQPAVAVLDASAVGPVC